MPVFDINYLAVFLSGVGSMVLGFIWYNPRVFGDKWLASLGRLPFTKEETASMQKGMAKTYTASFISSLVTAYVLAHVIDAFEVESITSGVQVAFWMWLGFGLVGITSYFLYERSLTLSGRGNAATHFIITAGYHLVNFVVMGAILSYWQ
jgi:hypothetical protein